MNHLTVQQLSAALDGALLGPSLEIVVRHLAACTECRDRQSRLVRHDDVLRRLLSPETDDAFLEALGARAEDIAVAIARGAPPPPMATSVPLLHEEDPYQPSEPPPDPGLGPSGMLAQEAGYGRIGMKPTASTQPPPADVGEARRWMDAIESGRAPDPSAFGVSPQPTLEPEPRAFELPRWMDDRAPRAPAAPVPPREPQVLRLVPPPHEPPPFESEESYPGSDPYATRMPYPPPDYPAPSPSYASVPRDTYEEPVAYRTLESTGYATRDQAILAARRRALEEARARGLHRHWLIAGASLGLLLLVVFALQLAPTAKDKAKVVLETPRPSDNSGLAPSAAPELRSASEQLPVEEVVPPTPRVAPADSAEVDPEAAPEDSVKLESKP